MAKKKRRKKAATRRSVGTKATSKKTGSARKRRSTGGGSGRGPGRKPSLAKLSVDELQAELERRKAAAGPLVRRREQLAQELAQLDRELQALGLVAGSTPTRGPGRPRGSRNKVKAAAPVRTGRRGRGSNERPLIDHICDVLRGVTMGVIETADAVQKAGYKTTSPNFRTIVNQALLRHTDRVKKVSRGKYTAA